MRILPKDLMNKLKQETARSLGKVASKLGNTATDITCMGFIYEPEIPKELLNRSAPCNINQQLGGAI